jgi:TonB family protein
LIPSIILSFAAFAQIPVDSNYTPPLPMVDFTQHLMRNLKYPEVGKENEIQGKVVLRFIITEDGRMENITVFKSVHPSLDKEAIRVVSMLDKWIPGSLNGKPTRCYFDLPISFRLEDSRTRYINSEYKGISYLHNSDWYFKAGERYYENDNLDLAFQNFQTSYMIDPSNLQAAYNCAAIRISENRSEEACTIINSLVKNGFEPAKELQKEFCNNQK